MEHNPLPDKIDYAFKGTVACDIRSLTSSWPDAVNRDLDNAHVERLKEIFAASLHRHLPEHRLKLTVSREEWETLLEFLVGGMQGGVIAPPLSTVRSRRRHLNLLLHDRDMP